MDDIVAPNEADYVKPNQTTPPINNINGTTKNKTKTNNTSNSTTN
jgi:hypothetical protein